MRERSERATSGDHRHRHLLSVTDLSGDDIERLLTLTDSFVEVSRRRMPKVPALQGRTVSWLFYEDSTRTRLSFEQAAKRLSADTLSFSVSTSSVNKGESLRDTVESVQDLGTPWSRTGERFRSLFGGDGFTTEEQRRDIARRQPVGRIEGDTDPVLNVDDSPRRFQPQHSR